MILAEATQSRMAVAAAALSGHAEFMALCEREIEAIFARHPSLERSDRVRAILWGLAFSELSRAVSTTAQTTSQAAVA